jgi:rod shape determining protein RodA
MFQKRTVVLKGKDWVMIWLYATISIIGLICIFSVEYKANDDFFKSLFEFKKNYSKQFFYLCFCIVLATFILLTDSKFFTATPNLLYILGILLMMATFVVGKNVNGSRSWIPLGFINLQPVETCKIFTALALAKYLSRNDTDFSKARSQLIAAGLCFLPAVFAILQNETGPCIFFISFTNVPGRFSSCLSGCRSIIGNITRNYLVVSSTYTDHCFISHCPALYLLHEKKNKAKQRFVIDHHWSLDA